MSAEVFAADAGPKIVWRGCFWLPICHFHLQCYAVFTTMDASVNTEEDLPVKPQKEWVHMDKMEPEKLEWLRDLPEPRRKGTKKVRSGILFASNERSS